MDGMTTYWLGAKAKSSAHPDIASIYTIFGDADTAMTFPPAFQVPAPFGADVGGVDPLLVAYLPTAAADSWLTVGPNEGSSAGSIATVGIDFSTWTDAQPLYVDNGAVFWMDPVSAPQLGPTDRVQMARVTVPTGTVWRAVVNVQGEGVNGNADDWKHHGLVFDNTKLMNVVGAAAEQAPPTMVGH
jgi:hypothetical protein